MKIPIQTLKIYCFKLQTKIKGTGKENWEKPTYIASSFKKVVQAILDTIE